MVAARANNVEPKPGACTSPQAKRQPTDYLTKPALKRRDLWGNTRQAQRAQAPAKRVVRARGACAWARAASQSGRLPVSLPANLLVGLPVSLPVSQPTSW